MVVDLPAWIAALSALAAVIMGIWNNRKIREVHISLNSRLSQLLTATKDQATADERLRAQGEINQKSL